MVIHKVRALVMAVDELEDILGHGDVVGDELGDGIVAEVGGVVKVQDEIVGILSPAKHVSPDTRVR